MSQGQQYNDSKITTLQNTKYGDEMVLQRSGYTLGKKIGEGAYAKVYTSEYVDPKATTADGKKTQMLACKVIDGNKAPKDFLKKFFPREISVICKVNHHYIIRIHSILKLSGKYYMFMTFCNNGDILSFMKLNGAVRERRARRWFAQILEGLDYLHQKNIVHRDLKCENILFNAAWNVKIADFGFAKFYKLGDELSKTYCGSVMYASPEVIHGTPYDPKLADIWSLGVLLFIMLNKSMPFDDSSLRKLYECQITRSWKIRSKIVDILSTHVKVYIYELLEPVPEKRKTLIQLRRDPWIMRGSFSEENLRNPGKSSTFISKIN